MNFIVVDVYGGRRRHGGGRCAVWEGKRQSNVVGRHGCEMAVGEVESVKIRVVLYNWSNESNYWHITTTVQA